MAARGELNILSREKEGGEESAISEESLEVFETRFSVLLPFAAHLNPYFLEIRLPRKLRKKLIPLSLVDISSKA